MWFFGEAWELPQRPDQAGFFSLEKVLEGFLIVFSLEKVLDRIVFHWRRLWIGLFFIGEGSG